MSDWSKDKLAVGVPLGGIIPRDFKEDTALVMLEQPTSALAETYRRLAAGLERALGGQPVRTLVISSATAAEGKTVTSLNLALALAEERSRKVVLVDADMRRPALSAKLTPPPKLGLHDVLAGSAPLEHALIKLRSSGLSVLPSGERLANPLQILQADSARAVLAALRERFDRVIVDTPPVVPFSDAAIIAAEAEASLLVVRAGRTAKAMVERASKALEGSRLLGAVLNDSKPTPVDRYYYHYDDYAPDRYTRERAPGKSKNKKRKKTT